ncbi:hypothetical protein FJZ19_03975 [Candidatus Pacearchaeota archaeon]|nr:hypothetical protein [Candidatus Pacearchaeota archaeon]
MCIKICEIHKNPLNLALHIFALIILIIGIWTLSIKVIIAAIIVALIGHLIQLVTRKKEKKNRRRK